MKSLQTIVGELNELGSADAIAEKFRREGIKGTPEMNHCCPVANYINASGLTDARVTLLGVCNAVNPETKVREDAQIADASPVANFVINFDEELYPDLVSEL